MPVKNFTKKRIVETNFKLCGSNFSKFSGLMLSKKQNIALIFKFNEEKIIRLHMLFVFYPIDVLFLNKNKIVVGKKENFKPFTFCKSKKKAMYAIELNQGIIKRTKTAIGDKIGF